MIMWGVLWPRKEMTLEMSAGVQGAERQVCEEEGRRRCSQSRKSAWRKRGLHLESGTGRCGDWCQRDTVFLILPGVTWQSEAHAFFT